MDTTRRKELKRAAKEAIPSMGVFRLLNTTNGRIMIGSSMNLAGAANSFSHKLEFFCHHNELLKADLAKSGTDAFVFEILETIDADAIDRTAWADTVRELEKKWLAELRPYGERGYNGSETSGKG
ncbi:MAG TPA: GIY-YIG nuclease family protein [Candidatus Ozemobacteraceae bacterium]|nr:GIY-YIG nuclease family protein [Candidatus Ozemobacteraceae bacterium]